MAINKTVNKSTKSHGAMRNVLEYVLRDSKTKEHLVTVTGPYDRSVIDYDNVYQAFLEEKRLWNKDSGRMYAHNVISFHKDEEITLEEAFDFGKEFAQKWFADFQTVVAVHQDKEHKHIHLVTNSVSFVDGHKLHATKKDMERMKELTNEMCRERGFTIAQKGKHFDGKPFDVGEVVAWSQDKYKLLANEAKESFLASCGLAVLNALESCTDKLQFIERMLEQGWETIWKDTKRHITFINEDESRKRSFSCLVWGCFLFCIMIFIYEMIMATELRADVISFLIGVRNLILDFVGLALTAGNYVGSIANHIPQETVAGILYYLISAIVVIVIIGVVLFLLVVSIRFIVEAFMEHMGDTLSLGVAIYAATTIAFFSHQLKCWISWNYVGAFAFIYCAYIFTRVLLQMENEKVKMIIMKCLIGAAGLLGAVKFILFVFAMRKG